MGASTKSAKPAVVNGINVDVLFALIDDVKRKPEKGKTNWRVITTWQGQTWSRAEIESYELGGEKVPRRFSIDIDEPRELGGSNNFANPQEHLIAALNACMTVGYVAQCATSIFAASSGSILRCRRATKSSATPFASRAAAPRSSSPRSTTR
jgi:hypothetical protein